MGFTGRLRFFESIDVLGGMNGFDPLQPGRDRFYEGGTGKESGVFDAAPDGGETLGPLGVSGAGVVKQKTIIVNQAGPSHDDFSTSFGCGGKEPFIFIP